MIFSETNLEISKALVAAWGCLESPKHNAVVNVQTRSGSKYDYSYTDLDGIFDAVKQAFKDNDIAILQSASTHDIEGLNLSVETMFLHSSGEWVKSVPLRIPLANQIKDIGGQITYLKRYSLAAMLGIATEKDDDASGVMGDQGELENQKLSDAQVKRLFAIASAADITVEQVKKVLMADYKKTKVGDLTKKEYDDLCQRLEAKKEAAHA